MLMHLGLHGATFRILVTVMLCCVVYVYAAAGVTCRDRVQLRFSQPCAVRVREYM